MALHTQHSLSGFIASEPQQSITENGDTRFYVRVGQPHFRHEYNGSFTALKPTFHDLVAYRATAERALTRFARGDSFVAAGYVRTFQVERDGEFIQREEFVAKKIGHDLAGTNYQVTRTNRPAPGSEQDAAATREAIVSETEAAHASSGW
ncbi:single-stranded DNA-binding protein [Cryobacterium sp. TMT1-3]|uniref:Single-stranded DNA-binding protein n=1 Tax=Cryobacterium luteum TaxID=1424661 RepID=A0A1H8IIX8_9MICO|nr:MULTISPECIES: single-stranded DNA-binding protein [Cryobacterium]TFB95487.1 single-stranded DNA-binding protein [Cryobacterium luteum]TFC31363.1 single-stranded DNA-binding protein [Cryobacterium sp. TMT1-3]SEN68683.1 Single-stranded DNA-binding protein [Cryobacterium luteum]